MSAGQVGIAEDRPPYAVFEKRPVEDRAATLSNGTYTTRDVDFAIITPAGSKDRVEVEAETWFANMAQEVQNKRFPSEWFSAYKRIYKDWLEGVETPLSGTPIKTWGGCSPAQRENLITWKVFTVEDLAAANEVVIMRLGMGGRQLKQSALDFLAASSAPGKLTAEMTDMRQRMDMLEGQNKLLREQNELLAASIKAPTQFQQAAQKVRAEESEDSLVETREVIRMKL